MNHIFYCGICNCATPHKVSYNVIRRNFYWNCTRCLQKKLWFRSPDEYTTTDNIRHASQLNRMLFGCLDWSDE